MNRAFRIIRTIFLVAGILLCLAVPLVGTVSTVSNWEGACEGAEGLRDCPWWEYAAKEMLWTSFLFIPLLFGAAVVWLLMAIMQLITANVTKWKEKAALSTRDERG